ncbi:MAG: GNAT family protein [Pseudomonadota bacterium]
MFEKITLKGKQVRLEPFSEKHKPGLCEAIRDGELWKLFFTLIPHPDDIDDYFEKADLTYKSGQGLAFVTIEQSSEKIVGSTRFMKANKHYKRVEIGYTFIRQSLQRSAVNTEAKFLMLAYAFENLGLNRVEFITDYFNTQSRTAILRLGAKQEGILRNHRVMPDGRVRDSVIFSIIANEWPAVSQNLKFKLLK